MWWIWHLSFRRMCIETVTGQWQLDYSDTTAGLQITWSKPIWKYNMCMPCLDEEAREWKFESVVQCHSFTTLHILTVTVWKKETWLWTHCVMLSSSPSRLHYLIYTSGSWHTLTQLQIWISISPQLAVAVAQRGRFQIPGRFFNVQ